MKSKPKKPTLFAGIISAGLVILLAVVMLNPGQVKAVEILPANPIEQIDPAETPNLSESEAWNIVKTHQGLVNYEPNIPLNPDDSTLWRNWHQNNYFWLFNVTGDFRVEIDASTGNLLMYTNFQAGVSEEGTLTEEQISASAIQVVTDLDQDPANYEYRIVNKGFKYLLVGYSDDGNITYQKGLWFVQIERMHQGYPTNDMISVSFDGLGTLVEYHKYWAITSFPTNMGYAIDANAAQDIVDALEHSNLFPDHSIGPELIKAYPDYDVITDNPSTYTIGEAVVAWRVFTIDSNDNPSYSVLVDANNGMILTTILGS